MTRKYTNKLIDMVAEGIVNPYDVVVMAVNYMSEAEVEDMMRCNDLILDEGDYEPGDNDEN